MATTVEKSWNLVQFLGDALKLLPEGAVLSHIEANNNAVMRGGLPTLGTMVVFISTIEEAGGGYIHRRVYEVVAGPKLILHDEVVL